MVEFDGSGESGGEPSAPDETGEDFGLQDVPDAPAETETLEASAEIHNIPEETLELDPTEDEGRAAESTYGEDTLEFVASDDEVIPDIPEESLALAPESDESVGQEEQDLALQINQPSSSDASDLETLEDERSAENIEQDELEDESTADVAGNVPMAQDRMLEHVTPLGPNDKEAERWNKEADAINEHNRVSPGTADERLTDFRREMGWETAGDKEEEELMPEGEASGGANARLVNIEDAVVTDASEESVESLAGVPEDEATSHVSDAPVEDKVEGELLEENNTKVSATHPESADEVESKNTQLLYNGEPVELDPDTFQYRTESPHREFELYWDIKRAEERAELGRQAATADSINDAIDTTLGAIRQSKEDESTLETQTREWLHLKHGSTPYTTDVYPNEGDESESGEREPDNNASADKNDH